ncbi:MAG: DUF6273 domain-containing protein [Brotaphodocola sp.]
MGEKRRRPVRKRKYDLQKRRTFETEEKRNNRFLKMMTMGILCTSAWSMPAYAGWIASGTGQWLYETDDGQLAVGWFQDTDSGWYHMGDDGWMHASQWYLDDDQNWYYLNEDGRMIAAQWFQDIDGKWYYLSQSGAMLSGCVTPDGYTVGADGTWDGAEAGQTSRKGSSSGGTSGSSGRNRSGSNSGSASGGSGGMNGNINRDSGENKSSSDGEGSQDASGSTDQEEDLEKLQMAMNMLFSWYDFAAQAESKVTGEAPGTIPDSRFLVRSQEEMDVRLMTIAGQILDSAHEEDSLHEEDGTCREVYVIGKNIVPNGTILKTIFRDTVQYSHINLDTIEVGEDIYYVSKFIIVRISDTITKDEKNEIEGYWNIGDMVTREIDGESYQFYCIDDAYGTLQGTGEKLVLFLCDSVIPADWNSVYVPQQKEDGVYEYEWIAGPIVNFGESNDYKYSAIRSWLNENDSDFSDAKEVNIGVSYAYSGETEEGMFGQFDESDLTASYIGNQKMMDKLFSLSVREALTYRDYLWCFEGEKEENPESQIGEFSKGYWLRTPEANAKVYVVDLVNGNLRPESIDCNEEDVEESADQELAATKTIGVRPAFVLEDQDWSEYGENGL